VTMEDSICERD